MNDLIQKLNLTDYTVTYDDIGRSTSKVIKLTNRKETLYLKIGNSTILNLSKVLDYLKESTIHAPSLLEYGKYNDLHYVLMTECKGVMTYQLDPTLAVKVLAQTLKELHSLPHPKNIHIKDVNHYQNEMRKIDQEKLTKEDLLFIEQLHHSELDNDMVFSHGDYCLPNILYENGNTSLIDLDYAGVTFRYSDILDCIWSLEYNFKTNEYTKLFLQEYGIKELNPKLVKEVKTIHRIMEIKGY